MTGWTFETLIIHLEKILAEKDLRYQQRFEAQELSVKNALQSAKEAVLKAEQAQEKRNEASNEFRGQLKDQAATLTPYNEFKALASRVDKQEGRTRGMGTAGSFIVPIVSATIALIAVLVAYFK
jgi:4-alpha-glucanotransferase